MKLRQIESEKIKSLSYDSVDWELAKLTDWLIKNLPERAEIVSYRACHAEQRNGTGRIKNTVDNWFTFTLDGWKIDFMPSDNWLFEGINLSAYSINNDTYQIDCYPLAMMYDYKNDNRSAFLELLSNPELLNRKQERIRGGRTKRERESNQEYVSRKRKIERVTYTI
jgi:hypothetical protein